MAEDPLVSNGGAHGDDGEAPPALQDEEEEKQPSLLQNLSDGFAYLRQRRDGKPVTPPSSVLPSFLTHVSVNFIDPTSSSITSPSRSSGDSSASGAASNKPVQLYEKFAAVFERDYASKLSYVPYQLFRNNSSGVIETLPVKTIVARSHGGGMVLSDDTAAVHDYSWERPYCHVYLAACESLEHYRTKVKPSIQAFVSQLESATKSASRQSSSDSGSNHGGSSSDGANAPLSPGSKKKKKKKHSIAPRYVIIFVPTGDRSKVDESQSKKGRVASVASRFAAARQRMTAVRGDMPIDSTHSGGDTSESAEDASDASMPSIHKLTKLDGEIARRFAHDFPSGNVCTLSSLAEESSVDGLDPDDPDKDSCFFWVKNMFFVPISVRYFFL
jgi:hypothetical protein